MTEMRVGFIGLGNVGAQLAGNLLGHGVDLTVRDLDPQRVAELMAGSPPRLEDPDEDSSLFVRYGDRAVA